MTLPGLGGGNRPNVGNRPGTGIANRPTQRPSVNDRQDRMNDRLNNRGDRQANRSERTQDRRNNWNDWHDHHYGHHGHWHNGHWHGHWGGGARWNYWWNNYPALTAFGVTTWAINRVGWAFGYSNYSNPYYSATYVDNSSYDYSQPMVMTPDEQSLSEDPAATAAPPGVSEEAMSDFDKAQKQFYDGDYATSLKSVDGAIKQMPNDAVLHEFRALTLFAQSKYPEAAATLYPVLAVGPGWDWTTMSSLYPDVAVYTQQLRKLEEARDGKPNDAGMRFLLAYHYVTCGHDDAAIAELKKLVAINPQDQVAIQMLQGLDPEAEIPKQPELTKPPQSVPKIDAKQIQGTWKAKRPNGVSFEMTLAADGKFDWKYTAQGKTQEVKGVWALDDKGVLAMEMNDEGTMLAQLDVKGSNMDFYMLGDTEGNPPLKFAK